MAVEGFAIIDDTLNPASGVDTDILASDVIIPGPVGVAVEVQVAMFQSPSAIFSINLNGTVFPVNNAAVIQGVASFTFLATAGDTINYQTSVSGNIRIITAVGGNP